MKAGLKKRVVSIADQQQTEGQGERVDSRVELLTVNRLDLVLNDKQVLRELSFSISSGTVTSLIGPSGAGKSSLLRCLNGLHTSWSGDISFDGQNIRQWRGGWDWVRREIGLIAQKPVVFRTSIRSNVCFGIQGWRQRRRANELIEQSLRQAALWDEVKDRLDAPASTLSVGQQQRLCIARALAINPRVLLLDEPTASLDPHSKQLIEQSLLELASEKSLLCVTHDLDQAQRLGGETIFICDGRVIEKGKTSELFTTPQALETREFLRWNVCDCD